MARVLLIDDDTSFGEITKRRLEKKGHEVTYQERSEGSLISISGGQFEIVVLDLGMPGISGEDLLNVMVKTGILEKTKVLLYSSSDEGRMRKLAESFAVSCVSKSASTDELNDAINALLS